MLRNGVFVRKKWNDISVGDILRVNNNEIFPADLILISSRYLNLNYLTVIIYDTNTILLSVNFMGIVMWKLQF